MKDPERIDTGDESPEEETPEQKEMSEKLRKIGGDDMVNKFRKFEKMKKEIERRMKETTAKIPKAQEESRKAKEKTEKVRHETEEEINKIIDENTFL